MFHFLDTYINANNDKPFWFKLIVFLLFHFIFPLMAITFYFSRSFLKISDWVLPRWWILGISITLVSGVGIILMTNIRGGSAYYFSNVSMFFALPLLIHYSKILEISSRTRLGMKKILRGFQFLALGLTLYFGPKNIYHGAKIFFIGVKKQPTQTRFAKIIQRLYAVRDDPNNRKTVIHIPRSESYQ